MKANVLPDLQNQNMTGGLNQNHILDTKSYSITNGSWEAKKADTGAQTYVSFYGSNDPWPHRHRGKALKAVCLLEMCIQLSFGSNITTHLQARQARSVKMAKSPTTTDRETLYKKWLRKGTECVGTTQHGLIGPMGRIQDLERPYLIRRSSFLRSSRLRAFPIPFISRGRCRSTHHRSE